jgi:TRAP-type C4-dicarboxylate transport system permease small subunit
MRRFFSLFWEVILASCVVILCIAVFLQVLLRYALKASFPPLEEIVTFSFIYTIFLGAAVGMKRMEHLNIDFLLRRAPQTLRKFFDFAIFLGTTLFLVFVVKEGILFVHDSYGQTTTYLNIPISYSYAAIPGSGLIMLYYVLKNGISIVLGKQPAGHQV